jgi:hypothetical protein
MNKDKRKKKYAKATTEQDGPPPVLFPSGPNGNGITAILNHDIFPRNRQI